MHEPAQNVNTNAIFMQKYTPKMFVAFKIPHFRLQAYKAETIFF